MGRINGAVSRAAALILLLAVCSACSACSSTPPSPDAPRVGCEFDSLRRFTYVLITSRIADQTTWVPRTMMSSAPVSSDRDQRTSPSIMVRSGYCPDEAAAMGAAARGAGGSTVIWVQPADPANPDGGR